MSMKKMVLGGVVGLVSLVLGATAFASGTPAPDAVISPVPTIIVPVPPVPYDSVCADGWHLAPNSVNGDEYACIPTKTHVMIECPPGLVYFDNGCTIGCEVPIK